MFFCFSSEQLLCLVFSVPTAVVPSILHSPPHFYLIHKVTGYLLIISGFCHPSHHRVVICLPLFRPWRRRCLDLSRPNCTLKISGDNLESQSQAKSCYQLAHDSVSTDKTMHGWGNHKRVNSVTRAKTDCFASREWVADVRLWESHEHICLSTSLGFCVDFCLCGIQRLFLEVIPAYLMGELTL